MTLSTWIKLAESEQDKNNHYQNYKFEKSNRILNDQAEGLFSRWLADKTPKVIDAQDSLEEFVDAYGYVKVSGAPVRSDRHGKHLMCVKSWRAVHFLAGADGVPKANSSGSALKAKLREIEALLDGPDADESVADREWIAFESALRQQLARLAPASRPSRPPPSGGRASSRNFRVVRPPMSGAGLRPVARPALDTSTTNDHLYVTWLAPFESVRKELGCDPTAAGISRSDLLAKLINLLGLRQEEEKDWDVRLLFILDSADFSHGELRRPTLFSGGFPDCYASAREADGWGRTARLNGPHSNPCGVGVPEAVCPGNVLARSVTVHYVGCLTKAMFDRAGRPNPQEVARNRFAAARPSGHTAI